MWHHSSFSYQQKNRLEAFLFIEKFCLPSTETNHVFETVSWRRIHKIDPLRYSVIFRAPSLQSFEEEKSLRIQNISRLASFSAEMKFSFKHLVVLFKHCKNSNRRQGFENSRTFFEPRRRLHVKPKTITKAKENHFHVLKLAVLSSV